MRHIFLKLAEPTAVVAGTMSDGAFSVLAGQTNLDTNAVSTNQSNLVFGWTGENPLAAPDSNNWLNQYTNKISAQNLAQITFTQSGNPDLAPVLATADIDGRWSTATGKALGNGTYTVLMTEYFNTGNQVGSQIGRTSKELTVTVALDELSLVQSSTNAGLTFETASNPDSQSAGNWVEFTLGAQGPASGSAVLLYVVDASGNYVGRDGSTGGDVTLAEAIRGVLGGGQSGAAAAQQSVYLETGQEIRFAQLTGQDTVDTTVTAAFQAAAGGGYDITLGDVTLSAAVQNTLDEAAILADAQRQTDIPLVYLEQGTLHDITASGASTLHHKFGFVRVDVGTDGSLKIDGKTLAEVRALGAKAKDLVDGGFEYLYSGTSATAAWTVSGATGFYAPIFFADDGSPYFIGDSTLDGAGQIRILGENTFGLENGSGTSGSDADYADLVIAFDTGRSATGNDLVAGSGNDDVLLGSSNNYALNGGNKLDTVVYDRTKDDVGLSGTRSGVTVTDGDGTDTLVAVELVVFTGANGTGQDRVLVINPDSSTVTGTYGFNEAVYLTTHADVAAAVAAGAFSSGAQHYALHGNSEDRTADLLFDAEFYLADNADVAAAVAAGVFPRPQSITSCSALPRTGLSIRFLMLSIIWRKTRMLLKRLRTVCLSALISISSITAIRKAELRQSTSTLPCTGMSRGLIVALMRWSISCLSACHKALLLPPQQISMQAGWFEVQTVCCSEKTWWVLALLRRFEMIEKPATQAIVQATLERWKLI
jgi:hypothetical protein